MARREIGTSWDRDNRNALNDNFSELYSLGAAGFEGGSGASTGDAISIRGKAIDTPTTVDTYPKYNGTRIVWTTFTANGGANINDASTLSTTESWSARKINEELAKRVKTINGMSPDLNGNVIVSSEPGGDYVTASQMGGLSLWKGTQAEYDSLTKDSNTLYFITG